MMDELEDDSPEIFDGKLQMIANVTTAPESPQNTCPTDTTSPNQQNQHSDNIPPGKAVPKDTSQRSIIDSISATFAPIVRKFSTSENDVAQQTTVALPSQTPTNFFTFREGIVEKALADCLKLIVSDSDGTFIGKFLLTEINLWDSDKERLVLLYTNSVLTVKYDFIALKILDYRRLPLSTLDHIVVGDLVYPPGSFVPDRNATGVRLMWNKGEPLKFAVKWNPFATAVPICTLTSHPLFHHAECDNEQRVTFSFHAFVEKLRLVAGREQLNINISYKSIVLQNYVGLSSLIHNRNDFGFFKVRGKFSF